MAGSMRTFLVFLGTVLFISCSTTKHLPPDEKLYTGARVRVEGISNINVKQKKTIRRDLEGLTRPRPNSRFLGIPIKLSIHNMFHNSKGFFGKLRDKFGEPPVLFSEVDLLHNEKVLQNYLENKGFFEAKLSSDTNVKAKTATAIYRADTGPQYKIKTVSYPSDSSSLAQHIQLSVPNALLKPGNPFDLDLIKGERLRIDAFLKERGFYYFGPDYLLVQVDTTEEGNEVKMRVVVKPETPSAAGEIFKINDVYVYSNYSLNNTAVDTSKAYAEFYEGYYMIDRDKMFKPRLFEQTMQFRPGEVYNRTDHNQSLNRLINLNLFKFVKNRFEPVAWLDSPRLDAYYYLTPLPKKSLRAEIGTTSKSNGLTGSQASVSWHNRNTFRAGQQLNITAFIGSEVQYNDSLKGFNTFRIGAEATLSYPRIVAPFLDFRVKSAYVPRTNITLGYEALNKAKLYTLNSFRFSYGYLWRESIVKQHEFNPISINYVQPFKVSEIYTKQMQQDFTLAKAIEQQFVLGSTYQYTFNELLLPVQKTNSFYFNGLVDVSGNVAGLITGASQDNRKKIFNAFFSQYIKLETEGRYYWKIFDGLTWANRLILGYGLPYGNSTELPFIKQFFVGGNNSIRAFRSRSVGPGSYLPVNTTAILPDQAGDIKFEVNTELRPRISGPLYGAIFLDAGNVWLKSPDAVTGKPGAQFGKDFIKQLGIGSGIGLRFDIVLFVIRLDVAFPLHKPWEDNPWVMNQVRFTEQKWRQQNIVYNLAIGYPF